MARPRRPLDSIQLQYVHERSTAREKAIISGEERYQGGAAIDSHRPASRVSDLGRGIDSQGVKNRGAEIVRAHRISGRMRCPAIRCARIRPPRIPAPDKATE